MRRPLREPAEPARPDQLDSEPLSDEPINRVPDDARLPPMPPGFDAEALARLENADTALMPSPPPPVPAGPPGAPGALAGADSSGPPSSRRRDLPGLVGHGCGLPVQPCQPSERDLCRICGSPIAPQGPRLIPRPALAVADLGRRDCRGGPRGADRSRPLEPLVQRPGAAADDGRAPATTSAEPTWRLLRTVGRSS